MEKSMKSWGLASFDHSMSQSFPSGYILGTDSFGEETHRELSVSRQNRRTAEPCRRRSPLFTPADLGGECSSSDEEHRDSFSVRLKTGWLQMVNGLLSGILFFDRKPGNHGQVTSIYHEIWGFSHGFSMVFRCKIFPNMPWTCHGHPEILPGATHAGMKSKVCCRTPAVLFLRKKNGRKRNGIPGECHGFKMFQCISSLWLWKFWKL